MELLRNRRHSRSGCDQLPRRWRAGRQYWVRARVRFPNLVHRQTQPDSWRLPETASERAVQLEREQAAEARRAVAEERTRIARELHDVVAHQVSLMTVQAGAATTVVADDPEGALQAMKAVEKAGRRALDELRHLMGILRPEAEIEGLGPQSGLADVPRLVEHLREAGLEVSLTMDGEQIELPARVDLSVYRIVQEALTNVLKHAGPSTRTEVRLSTDNHGVTIEVLDNGYSATILPGSGHLLIQHHNRDPREVDAIASVLLDARAR